MSSMGKNCAQIVGQNWEKFCTRVHIIHKDGWRATDAPYLSPALSPRFAKHCTQFVCATVDKITGVELYFSAESTAPTITIYI